MVSLMNIPCDFSDVSLYNIKEVNSSFATGTLKVMYLGKNRNGSYFSKDAVEKALPSLKNVPIVCRWDDEAGEFGGHDIAIVSCEDGGLRIKNLTEPCGVVPDHARFSFQKCSDDDGNEHEYLVIDGVILWKRQDVYRHIVNDLGGRVDHSMEINVLEGNSENEYYHITKFEFSALCLLGNCEPCFQGSELNVYSVKNFKRKMEQMMLEIKESFSMVTTSLEEDIHPQKISTEGGKKALDEKFELAKKYGIDVNTLDFSIEDYSLEELEEKFKNILENNKSNDKTHDEPENSNFALESNVRSELIRLLESETIHKDWGETPKYLFVDYSETEIFGWSSEDGLLYGFMYAIDGDAVSIDFACKKRKKFDIIDFDYGEQGCPPAQMYSRIEEEIKRNTELTAKYQAASETIESMKSQIGELQEYKNNIESAAAQEAKNRVFDEFKDLSGIDAFEALKNDYEDLTPEIIEEKCYAIRGRNTVATNFSVESVKAPKLKVAQGNKYNMLYGGIFEQYGVEA